MLQELTALLSASAKETGVELLNTPAEVAEYALQRSQYLATLQGQVGFEHAVVAERDAIVLFAGLSVVNKADAAQAKFIGVIQGAISIASIALTKGVG